MSFNWSYKSLFCSLRMLKKIAAGNELMFGAKIHYGLSFIEKK